MTQQVPVDAGIEAGTPLEDGSIELGPSLTYRRLGIVNVFLYGARDAGDRGWVLVDAGVPGSSSVIEQAAASRFGRNARPSAILLTHGHFDHVSALQTLAGKWDLPVYAHPLEQDYLNGTRSYPPARPSMSDGLLSLFSPLWSPWPNHPRLAAAVAFR